MKNLKHYTGTINKRQKCGSFQMIIIYYIDIYKLANVDDFTYLLEFTYL